MFQEPHPDPRKPFWDGGSKARAGHEVRKEAVESWVERNRKPVNRAEIAKKSRRPVPSPEEL